MLAKQHWTIVCPNVYYLTIKIYYEVKFEYDSFSEYMIVFERNNEYESDIDDIKLVIKLESNIIAVIHTNSLLSNILENDYK